MANLRVCPADRLFTRQFLHAEEVDFEALARWLGPTAAMMNRAVRQYNNDAVKAAETEFLAQKAKHDRAGVEMPPYDLEELIGKGAFGRVYKAWSKIAKRVVAVKIIDVDDTDYKQDKIAKDDTIESTINEIKVLKQLADSKARNVNLIVDAFESYSQLWIVSEYCPGGSVRTLMRGTDNMLKEKYIIVVARELALALQAVHAAGIIHRDVKAANVMINEEGHLQLIDFGVAGILQSKMEKRSTIIGTPHWMPPELLKPAPPAGLHYGTEVDVWAFGCTLIECATGAPPNARLEPGRRLGVVISQKPPQLGEEYPQGLRELVASVLEAKPVNRPTMSDVLQHPYLAGSEKTHPTKSLAQLVKAYYRWEFAGGKRSSLLNVGGAPASEFPTNSRPGLEEWNFSTTLAFAEEVAAEEQRRENSTSSATSSSNSPPHTPTQSDFESNEGNTTPKTYQDFLKTMSGHGEISSSQSNQQKQTNPDDERVKRGELALQGLFSDEGNGATTDQTNLSEAMERQLSMTGQASSDLPLRSQAIQPEVRHEVEFNNPQRAFDVPVIALPDAETIRARRNIDRSGADEDDKAAMNSWKFPDPEPKAARPATMDWTFPEPAAPSQQPEAATSTLAVRPQLHHATTAPAGPIPRNDSSDFLQFDMDARMKDGGPPSAARLHDYYASPAYGFGALKAPSENLSDFGGPVEESEDEAQQGQPMSAGPSSTPPRASPAPELAGGSSSNPAVAGPSSRRGGAPSVLPAGMMVPEPSPAMLASELSGLLAGFDASLGGAASYFQQADQAMAAGDFDYRSGTVRPGFAPNVGAGNVEQGDGAGTGNKSGSGSGSGKGRVKGKARKEEKKRRGEAEENGGKGRQA
ncbi:hypothetical protein MMC25_004572 [Agyrium rufum]|nr:hypothetical protein [Agyrium rufum]